MRGAYAVLVFADHVLFNLFVFVVGQAAAWWNLHTGRFWLGITTTVALWLLLDWWLLARYVFGASGASLIAPLLLMQVVAVAAAAAQLWAQWRRRWSSTARSRPQLFTSALVAYMRDDHGSARALLRRLVFSDPWDVAAWLALGDVHRQLGEGRHAKWCYLRARGVDTAGVYGDLLRYRQMRGPGTPLARPKPSI
jgi:hypothetical protein